MMMVDLALLQSVSYIAGALGVCVAATYYIVMLNSNRKTRQAELILRMMQMHASETINKAFNSVMWEQKFKTPKEWIENYGPITNPEAYQRLLAVYIYLNGLGMMAKEGMIPEKMIIDALTSAPILLAWKRFEPIVGMWRSRYEDEAYLEGFEYLAKKTMEYKPKAWQHTDLDIYG
jgi:hypothetical protein